MSLPVQLISTDFDGTIFAEFENPPVPETLQRLLQDLQAQGARWVINTGRDLTSLMEAVARSGLSVRPDYLVLVEREIYIHQDHRYVGLTDWNDRCARDHAALYERMRADVPRLTAWINEHFNAEVYADPWSPLCLLARSNPDTDAIEAFLREYCRTVPNLTITRNDVYARFSHTAYSKGTALTEIARRLGIASANTIAVGDHLNDLTMLKKEIAGYLAAPSNALPEVKAAVQQQGGLVSHLPHGHGVARALKTVLTRFLADSTRPSP
ncbi:MAG TPA: HAD family hydrolase [Verrucomicrobiota bacterium]|nr:HAD family hydrolase [Verrucomicrobiota bacterium]